MTTQTTNTPLPTYRALARRRYRQALWILGSGPYASLAYCRELTVILYDTQEQALKGKDWIDRLGCGGACRVDGGGDPRMHVIEDLTTLGRWPMGKGPEASA